MLIHKGFDLTTQTAIAANPSFQDVGRWREWSIYVAKLITIYEALDRVEIDSLYIALTT